MFNKKFVLITFCFTFLVISCNKREGRIVTFAVGGAPSELEFWQVIVKEFDSQTGIKVDILRQPTDTDQRRQGLLISLKSRKNDPDVFLMDNVLY